MTMIYPESFETKIAFDQIRNLLKAACLSDASKLRVDEIQFSNDISFIKQKLKEVEEMLTIFRLKDNYPANNFPETAHIIQKLKIENSSLQLFEILDIRTILENVKAIINFFKNDTKNEFPTLKEKLNKIIFPKFIYERIDSIISKNGTVKDNASPELRNIRTQIVDKQSNISRKLTNILGKIKEEGWVSKDLSATYVNGRLVLPIETSYKRKIQGMVVDESASGKTTYIEPQEVVELNNILRELELAENREIQKILFDLTCDLRPYLDDLANISDVVSEFDLIYAKAKVSAKIGAIIPSVVEDTVLELSRAKHPLLEINLKKEKKEIIPISFNLSKEERILVISGPNAGGKSVCLKTTALLVYMVQCGLPVPVGGSSVFGIFNNIFIDIGDQQSIENDLSTYSSHLQNMKFFLKNSDKKTMILIDEFGSGTDPIIGGLIAETILESFNNTDCFGVITTHYSNLKIFASNTAGIANAAMLIDSTEMQPTFILETGIPGSSYALEIAQRIGLPQDIVEKTKQKSDNNVLNFDKLLHKTLKDKHYWENKCKEIKQQEKKLDEVLQKNLAEIEKLKKNRDKIIADAKNEAETLLTTINKKIENTVRTIVESNADKEIVKQNREEISRFKESVDILTDTKNDELEQKADEIKKKIIGKQIKQSETEQKSVKIDENKINIGSIVRIKGQTVNAEVIDMNEKSAVISFGSIFTTVEFSKLEKLQKNEIQQPKRSNLNHLNYNNKVINFNPNVDVRGYNVDDAIEKIRDLVDDAIMLSIKELRILHGKGNGILRLHIRDYLRKIPQVEKIYSEDVQFGGDGITIVKFK